MHGLRPGSKTSSWSRWPIRSKLAANSVAQEAKTRAVADYRELIGEIEAAIIATPTTYHHAIGMELLGCGVPLFIEKPIAITSQQANDLVTLARQKNVDAAGWPCRAIQSGTHGRGGRCSRSEIHRSHSHQRLHVSLDRYRRRDGHDDPRSGYRAVAREVDGRSTCRRWAFRCSGGHEDMATARLTFASGCVAQSDGLASQLPAEADDVDLHVARQRVDQLRDARSDGRETERRGSAARVSRRSAFGRRAGVLERACVRPSCSCGRSAMRSR